MAEDNNPNANRFQSPLWNWMGIVLSHFLILVIGLVYWNYRIQDLFPELARHFYLTGEEKQVLLKYGLTPALLYIAALHFLAWRAVRRFSETTHAYIPTLGLLCRSLWPAAIALFALIGFFVELKLPLYLFFSTAALSLSLGNLTKRYLELTRPAETADHSEHDSPALADAGARKWWWATMAAAGLYIAWFSYLSIMRHLSIGTNLHDFSLYDQMLWNTIRGDWFRCTLWQSAIQNYDLKQYGYNFCAEHFMPSLLLLAPFYAVFQHPITLLFAQSAALGAAAVPLFYIARKKLDRSRIAFFFALAFLLHPLVQQTNIKEFHMDAFEPLFLLLAYAAYLHRRMWLFWLSLVLAMGCKEDVSIQVAALGLFIVLGESDWKTGAITLALGLCYYFMVAEWIIPYFRDGEPSRQLYRFGHLLTPEQQAALDGPITAGLVIKTLLFHPVHVIKQVVDQDRLISLFMLALPFGMFVVAARWAWIWVLPMLAINLMVGWEIQYRLELHYGIAIVPSMAAASVIGVGWLCRRKDSEESMPRISGNCRTGALLALLISALMVQHYFGYLPGSDAYSSDKYKILPHNRLAREYLDAVPPDAPLSAQTRIGAQVARRRSIYLFPEIQDAEYILLDTRGGKWPLDKQAYEQEVLRLLNSKEWGLILPYRDGYLLFQRGHSTELNEAALGNLNFSSYR